MKIVILGSGIAGCMAAGVLASYDPTMIEPKACVQFLKKHKAVMRISDPRVALALGMPAKKITVHKAIWSNGTMRTKATLRDNNLYSLKVSGFINNRSIIRTEIAERLLLEGVATPKCEIIHSEPIESVQPNQIFFENGRTIYFDFCISTIPMPIIYELVGLCPGLDFITSEITVLHYVLNIPTLDSYQTIYYPDASTPLYRATLQDGKIIAEIIGTESLSHTIDSLISKSFGINTRGHVAEKTTYVQKQGKMETVDNNDRKRLIYQLTNKFNIFSLGRFAIWKPIRADHLISDIGVISEMMRSQGRYEIAKQQEGRHES